MKFYNLGEIVHYHDYDAIRFKTSLFDLMDAYYMEKQRIEHIQTYRKDDEQFSF